LTGTIVTRILAGESSAETELVECFQPRIRAFVRARTSNPEMVEDVAQNTIIAVICALREGKLRDASALSAFVYGVARNQLADAFRGQGRENAEPLKDDQDFPAPAAEQEPETMETARREIEALEPTDRRILWACLIDGYKPGEIAAALGLSPEMVRQRKSRALKRLVEKLAPVSRNSPRPRQ
jgi:RNA polymerase sigma factor (sigma-70 family)